MVYLREESHVILLNDFALLELTGGEIAIIDIDDAQVVSQYEWRLHSRTDGNSRYVLRRGADSVWLHRFIKGLAPDDEMRVDHINGDTLDNRRTNLRVCTQTENLHNWMKVRYKKCDSRGVSLDERGLYSARIMSGKKRIFLGRFAAEDEAALAYQEKAGELYGDFAVSNRII